MSAACLLALGLSLPAYSQKTPESLPSLAQPSLSPDGKEIAFVSGGDIWTVPAGGGDAHLLISDPAEESRPLYSPDGTRLAFMSTRTGGGDIYVLTFATGRLQRITFSDSASNLDAWSRDGKWLYFTSTADDVAGQGDIFRVGSGGGTPLEVSRERYINEFESAPSPDGVTVAFMAKGISSSQWWRNGGAHIDETEIWLKPAGASSTGDTSYRLLVPADAKHAWPMWSSDGHSILFMSNKSGSENLWSADSASGAAKQLTHFTSGRCLWPSIAYDGSTVVFERGFSIWRMDAHSGKAEPVHITLRGVPSSPGVSHMAVTGWSDLALSPDGKKIAVAGHGDIFAAGAKEGGEAQRLTRTVESESDPVWSADSTHVLYLSQRDGGSSIYEFDESTGSERALTHGRDIDLNASYSPDGKLVAYLRNRKELHVLTLNGLHDHVVATGEINEYGSNLAWSPDSHWIVYLPLGTNGFDNLWVVPADGSAPGKQVTFLANGQNGSHIAWSPDGKYILFDTSQRAEQAQLARVDLIPHVPSFREDQFRDLFRKQSTPGAPDTPANPENQTHTGPATETPGSTPEPPKEAVPSDGAAPAGRRGGAAAAAKKPVEPTRIVFEGIRERLTLLPIGLGVRFPVISPDGKTLAFLAEVAGQFNIYTYPLDELAREPASPRQLTSTPGGKNDLAFTPDSKELFYLEGGGGRGGGGEGAAGVRSISLDTRMPHPVQLSAAVDVDFDREKMVVFDEAWTTLEHRFFRGDFNGHDWSKLREEWRPYVAGARTGPELRRDINLLIGELNSSHSGINRPSVPAVRTGRLGLRFERAPFEDSGRLIVREVVPLGPAAIEGSIHTGDRLLAVDGEAIGPKTNLDSLLEDKANRRVVLSTAPGGNEAKKHDAIVRPVTIQIESGLLYRSWVEERRAYVDKVSGGKLGYVHIAAMGDADLAQLYLDLDVVNQSKQGVVVDVRNNNGGYVNGRVIDVFARRNYLMMTPRDGSTVPSRQSLGQRALGLPTVLVTNESTLSDGEDFTEGYRTLGLGKVVGTPTAGWIIFTGAQRLIDGSSVRVPGDRIKDTRGEDMELHPRPVDVEQLQPLGETEKGQDVQLEKAVQTLLGQLK
jgi:Tol biopolymer transport system component/C-terminal processing protease CtpA/Prc